MSPLPRITLVTPNLNQGRYLEQAIRSVLDQGYPDLEYFVKDGGSTDGSLEILQRYSGRLSGWTTGKDAGQAAAIQEGFGEGTGEILGWLNADDLLFPGCLEKVGRFFLHHPGIGCVVGGSLFIGEEGEPVPFDGFFPSLNLGTPLSFRKLLFWECGGFCQPASFWRADLFRRAGGLDAGLRFCFDYDMYLKLAKLGDFGLVEELLAGFRLHPLSKSSTILEVCKAEKEIVWRRHGKYRAPWAIRSLLYWYYSRVQRSRLRRAFRTYRIGALRLPIEPGSS